MTAIFFLGIVSVALGGFFLLAPKVAQEINRTLNRAMNQKIGQIGEDIIRSRMWVGIVLVLAGILMMSQGFLHR